MFFSPQTQGGQSSMFGSQPDLQMLMQRMMMQQGGQPGGGMGGMMPGMGQGGGIPGMPGQGQPPVAPLPAPNGPPQLTPPLQQRPQMNIQPAPTPDGTTNPLASILGNGGGATGPGLMQIINAMRSNSQVNGPMSGLDPVTVTPQQFGGQGGGLAQIIQRLFGGGQ